MLGGDLSAAVSNRKKKEISSKNISALPHTAII